MLKEKYYKQKIRKKLSHQHKIGAKVMDSRMA